MCHACHRLLKPATNDSLSAQKSKEGKKSPTPEASDDPSRINERAITRPLYQTEENLTSNIDSIFNLSICSINSFKFIPCLRNSTLNDSSPFKLCVYSQTGDTLLILGRMKSACLSDATKIAPGCCRRINYPPDISLMNGRCLNGLAGF
ncbi:hypothetical protein TNCV_52881 [Trichonephila clavipes]|nr:hypothetical protein TNCV_52881 [Trichonephila clavipes]